MSDETYVDAVVAMATHMYAHRDGLHVVSRTSTDDEGQKLPGLAVEEHRDGKLYTEHLRITVPNTGNNAAYLRREECLLDALCDYVNAGGQLATVQLYLTQFNGIIKDVISPAETIPGELVDVVQECERTLYYRLHDNTFFKVVENQFIDILTTEEMYSETGYEHTAI